MSTNIQKVRFLEGRRHKFRRPKSSLIGLSDDQIYERKQQQRRERAEEISNNSNLLSYIQWIIAIQEKLNLSNAAFAKRLGITAQSVKLWKRKSGHFPSERTYKRLLMLERECKIPIRIIKIKYGVRM